MKRKTIKKILIANRGEIAVRVIRACKEMEIQTVAIFSDADRRALHVQMADEAYRVGPSPANQSYLNQEKIIQIAHECQSDAIHPGYGFLSENADFADLVEKEGIVFIGPTGESIRMMANKTNARKKMNGAGIPIVPGTLEPISSPDKAQGIAEKIGYPLLIKAIAGGGGKGMRLVLHEKDLLPSLRSASSEAESAFGDGSIYFEKYLEGPHHVEFQVLADSYGNVVHLGERECSIQRRHQKVIEESPSPILTPALRKKMAEMALKVVQTCKYINAGTVEFLVDAHHHFYFLEMNTRLQVEHPVTELVTGIDLVKKQISIARGEPLSLQQKDIHWNGHAIQCRIYAEDPYNNFLPSIGTITYLKPPNGPGIREDSGVFQGWELPIDYDPMISKLLVWGESRTEAIVRMKRALEEYDLQGVNTTIPFCHFVMTNNQFQSGDYDTHFIDKHFSPDHLIKYHSIDESLAAIAAVLFDFGFKSKYSKTNLESSDHHRPISNRWKDSGRKESLRKQ